MKTIEELQNELATIQAELIRLQAIEVPDRSFCQVHEGLEVENLLVTRGLWAEVMDEPLPDADDLHRPKTKVNLFDIVEFMNRRSVQNGLTPVYYYIDGEKSINNLAARVTADGYRLPSESDYLYYARGEAGEDPYGPVEDVAVCDQPELSQPPAVGQKKPTRHGIYDVIGLVWRRLL